MNRCAIRFKLFDLGSQWMWTGKVLSFSTVSLMLGGIVNSAFGEVHQLWAVGDGQKIDRLELNSPFSKSNSVWDGERIRIFAARNEIVAFQVIVESDERGIGSVDVSLSELRHEKSGSRIIYSPPNPESTDYKNQSIQLFSVNYMQVTKPTKASWIYRSGPSAPADPTGWKPVQLVPENAKVGKGGFPLAVQPLNNQAIWIEVYTGRDRPAGVYRGTIQVIADGQEYSLPLELRLFNFNLSDKNTIHAMVYFEGDQPVLYQGHRLDTEYHRFAHRNRIELVHAYSIESATENQQRFLGGDFTSEESYVGPGEGVGNIIIPNTFYGPGSDYDDRESAWRTSDEWINFLDTNLQEYLTFAYMPDEPDSSQFNRIRNIANNIHSNPGPGRRLPIFVTAAYNLALEGSIDYWCTGPQGYDIDRAIKERTKGHEYWIYNGGRPFAGAVVIDAPATDPRAIIWACFKHEIDLYFYWHSVHWRHNHQMKAGVPRNQDVWGNPITFDTGGSYANGDGVLIYPGEEVLHPEHDRGIPGPISTIQLANFRRGLQDHQYLVIASRLGLKGLTEEAIQEVVPRVFSETEETIGFAELEETFESARFRLGLAIEEARQLRRRR